MYDSNFVKVINIVTSIIISLRNEDVLYKESQAISHGLLTMQNW